MVFPAFIFCTQSCWYGRGCIFIAGHANAVLWAGGTRTEENTKNAERKAKETQMRRLPTGKKKKPENTQARERETLENTETTRTRHMTMTNGCWRPVALLLGLGFRV